MDFTPLRISTVKPLRNITFDLYIYFKEQYLCYANRGQQFTEEKYQKLKTQKIAKFYITEKDEVNYQKYLDELLAETINDASISVDEKVNIAEGSASTAIEQMQKNPSSASAYRMTETAAKSLRIVIKNNPDALKKIFGKKAEKSEEIIKHSLNVCALACKLGEILRFSEQELDDLGTAALIHDIGLTQMSKKDMELFYKAKKLLGNEDKRVYYMHTKDAMTLLQEKPYINKAILDLVANHEENLSGQGPNKLKKLTEIEQVLSLVNNYDKRTITNKTSPAQTLKDMMIDELGNYELEMLNKFKQVLISQGMIEE